MIYMLPKSRDEVKQVESKLRVAHSADSQRLILISPVTVREHILALWSLICKRIYFLAVEERRVIYATYISEARLNSIVRNGVPFRFF